MPLVSRISAAFALLAFVAGGLVGPVLHRAEHGLDHAAERQHIAAQTAHVHVDGIAAFTVSLDGLGDEHAHCMLCVPPKHVPPGHLAVVGDGPLPFPFEYLLPAFDTPGEATMPSPAAP